MKKFLLFFVTICFFYAADAQQTTAKDTSLQQYVGKYKFPEGSVVTEVEITIKSGELSVTSSVGVSPLEKTGDDLFTITTLQGTAKFNRDANKKVTGISINAGGYQLEGTRVEAERPAVATRIKSPGKKEYENQKLFTPTSLPLTPNPYI